MAICRYLRLGVILVLLSSLTSVSCIHRRTRITPATTPTARISSDSNKNNQNKHSSRQHPPPPWLHGFKNGLASALSAACAKTVLQPIDAVKTMQQYSQKGRSGLTVLGACQELMQRPGGVSNFYAGLGVTVIGAMPGVALYFGVYSSCKRSFLQTDFGKQHKTLAIAMSAAIGNSVASFSRVPYEVVKQQLQTGIYDNTWQALSAIAKSPQWFSMIFPRGGVAIQMLRDVPYAVVTLIMYEHLQASFGTKRVVAQQKSRAWDFALGGIAGGVGSWVTNPLDVLKTRLQTDSQLLYDGSVLRCMTSTWQEGGLPVLLRGSVPRLAHKIPANAFFFFFYEFFRRVLKVEDDNIEGGGAEAAKIQVKR